ncbi:MAG: cytochrome c oxidase subunit 3 [Acidimicrobiales bacterium]
MASPILALPAAGADRPANLVRTCVMLAISSATMLFGGVLAAYLQLRRTVVPWPPEDLTIDQYFGNMMALTMLLAVIPVEWACYALRRGLVRQAMTALAVAIGLGLAFLNLLSYTAGHVGFDAASHPYGLVLTAMVMLLGISVAAGVVMLTLTLIRAAGRQQGPHDSEQSRVAACWWHFTVIASIAVWYAVVVLQ